MKKIIGLIGVFVIAIAGVFIAMKSRGVGDFRPALLPPQGNVTEIVRDQNLHPERADEGIHVPEGYKIGIFADSLGSPRDLTFSPKGTLLASIISAGTVVAFPDDNHDGTADKKIEVLSGLQRPHGLAFYDGYLFVAEETRVSRYTWDETSHSGSNKKVLFSLPAGGRHFTRSIAFNAKGELFVSLGSTCDTCVEKNQWISTILVSDENGKEPQVYARGLRNAVFITVNPKTQELWGTEMGRDFLGDITPPDEINILRNGKDYGWPFCYGNKLKDSTFQSGRVSERCSSTEAPAYELPAHVAPLGLTFDEAGNMLVALHGSWNSSTPVGYKVVKLSVSGTVVTGMSDYITGFLKNGGAIGRPVDVVFDSHGSLFISDDKAGVIYIVYKQV